MNWNSDYGKWLLICGGRLIIWVCDNWLIDHRTNGRCLNEASKLTLSYDQKSWEPTKKVICKYELCACIPYSYYIPMVFFHKSTKLLTAAALRWSSSHTADLRTHCLSFVCVVPFTELAPSNWSLLSFWTSKGYMYDKSKMGTVSNIKKRARSHCSSEEFYMNFWQPMLCDACFHWQHTFG